MAKDQNARLKRSRNKQIEVVVFGFGEESVHAR